MFMKKNKEKEKSRCIACCEARMFNICPYCLINGGKREIIEEYKAKAKKRRSLS